MKGLAWFKSSYSSGNGACVDCAPLPDGGMAVRDTQNRDGAVPIIPAETWRRFTHGLK